MNYQSLATTFLDYEDVFLEEDAFYKDFKKVIRSSDSTFSLIKKQANKHLELDWIEIIEDCIASLDKLVRNPRKDIETREEILPIEISRNITSESIKHLSQHTNFISKIEGDKITPSKILNVFKEETLNTYENKFINTLLNRLYIFVDKRYRALTAVSDKDNYSMLKMEQEIEINENEKLEISFEIKSSVSSGKTTKSSAGLTDIARVLKLEKIVSEYQGSDFVKNVGKFGFIRPPVMRTNAIMKDKDLRKCLNLWIFIESYEKIGYKIDTLDVSEKPKSDYINELYGITAIQYALFKMHTIKDEVAIDEEDKNILRKVRNKKGIVPKFVKDIYDEFSKDYNLSDTQFRKIMNTGIKNISKTKTPDEIKIRKAIDDALKEEKEKCKLKKA